MINLLWLGPLFNKYMGRGRNWGNIECSFYSLLYNVEIYILVNQVGLFLYYCIQISLINWNYFAIYSIPFLYVNTFSRNLFKNFYIYSIVNVWSKISVLEAIFLRTVVCWIWFDSDFHDPSKRYWPKLWKTNYSVELP